MAGIQGTNIVAPVVPLDTADVHPTHEAQYGKGGYRTVATTADRDALPAARREGGLLVFVTADSQRYRLGAELTTWTLEAAGASSCSEITGKPAPFPPAAHTHAIADTTGLQAALDGKASVVSPFFNTQNGPSQFYDATEFATEIQGGQINTQSIGFQANGYGNRQTHPYTPAERTKLAGIATGATANATDAQLRDRSTHTGTQAANTITGLAASATTDATNAANITSGTLALARLPVVVEKSASLGNTGSTLTLSLSSATVQTASLSANCTFTMPTASAGASITLFLAQTGSFTAAFTGVKWSGGTAPTITTGSTKTDVLVFVSDGTSWFGTALQNF